MSMNNLQYAILNEWLIKTIKSYTYFTLCILNWFILDFDENDSENEVIDLLHNTILCENNSKVLSNELKNKKRKKRKKKLKDSNIKCSEVEEMKKLLLQTIEQKDTEALKKYLLLEGVNNFISKEHLENSLNEAIDETNNTLLHLASINCLHDHI